MPDMTTTSSVHFAGRGPDLARVAVHVPVTDLDARVPGQGSGHAGRAPGLTGIPDIDLGIFTI